MMKSVAVRLVCLVLLGAGMVAGVLVYKQNEKAGKGEELLAEFIGELAAVEADAAGHGYIEGLARRFHEESYRRAFNSGGELTGGTIDVNRYQRESLDAMIAQAKKDGSTHIAEALGSFGEGAVLELGDP